MKKKEIMKHIKSIVVYILTVCMVICCFPYAEKDEREKIEVAESECVVRGYGNKIKNEKSKKVKTKVNEGKQNGKTWNRQMIQIENIEETGVEIKVAIIDSGINFSDDITVVERKNFIPDGGKNVLYEDPSGHGTAIAGIIGALENEEGISGINPRVKIYSARVLDEKLEAPVGRIVEAIDWAIEQNVDIINMSFGTTKNVAELESAIKRAAAADILMIAAVGDQAEIAYPAAYDEVIAVGSVTSEGKPAENSAKGEVLELMAPGENIMSSGIFGGVVGASGTSMATPHVVGTASVLMELNPDMPVDYIRALLNYSANLYGTTEEYGNGVVDLSYAIEINDKFKKIYEKHLGKTGKGKKQKEKFWGEVKKVIPENDKTLEVFTELDIVEGMWLKDNSEHEGDTHEDFVYDGIIGTQMNFTSDQMTILTYACGYPDAGSSELSGAGNPYHGHLWEYQNVGGIYSPIGNSNYIANYIHLTKIARAYGDASSVSRGPVLSNDYNEMLEDFSTTTLGNKTWQQVFALMNAERGSNIAVTPENIKLFIYGIAIHSITDIFAHSAWADQNGWKRIGHTLRVWETNADNPNYFPLRFDMAFDAAKLALTKAYNGSEGLLTDFILPHSGLGTFYLGNFVPYVKAVNVQIYNAAPNSFNRVDLAENVIEYYFEGQTYYVP